MKRLLVLTVVLALVLIGCSGPTDPASYPTGSLGWAWTLVKSHEGFPDEGISEIRGFSLDKDGISGEESRQAAYCFILENYFYTVYGNGEVDYHDYPGGEGNLPTYTDAKPWVTTAWSVVGDYEIVGDTVDLSCAYSDTYQANVVRVYFRGDTDGDGVMDFWVIVYLDADTLEIYDVEDSLP